MSRLIGAELGRIPRLHPRTAPRLAGGAGETSALVEEHVEREWANGVPTGVVHTRHVDAQTGKAIEARVPPSVQRKAAPASASEPLTRDASSTIHRGNAPAASFELPASSTVSRRGPAHEVAAPEAGRPPDPPTSASASAQVEPDAIAAPPATERILTELTAPAREQLPPPRAPASASATERASDQSLRPAWAPPAAPHDSANAVGGDDALQQIPALQTPPPWERGSRELQQSDSDPVRELQSASVSIGLNPSSVPNAAGGSRTAPVAHAAAPALRSSALLAAASMTHEAARGAIPETGSGAGPEAAVLADQAVETREETTRARSSLPSLGAVAGPESASAPPPVQALGFGLGSGGLAEAIRAFAASASPSDAPNLGEIRTATDRTATDRSAPATPVVRIRIGRLEVHAPAVVPAVAPQVERAQSGLSLEALLRLREGS